MFDAEEINYEMVLGAYKKIKSYYYYNKNFLFMREKIAIYENDQNEMDKSLHKLALILKNPHNYNRQINAWIEEISYYVLPKGFEEDKSIEDRFVSSTVPNKTINKVNFFIDMPMELHILETVWMLYVGKLASDKKIISEDSYGNVIDEKVVFNDSYDFEKSVNHEKRKIFKIYFSQYCEWRNNAIKEVERNKKDKNTLLVSLDIKGFFYSVKWNFDDLEKIVSDDKLKELQGLTNVIYKIFRKYTFEISEVKEIIQNPQKDEFVLPIGLFSSMLLANIYLSQFDSKVRKNSNVLYYGRYVDDMLILINVSQLRFDITDNDLERILVSELDFLTKKDTNKYALAGIENLIIQKNKLKIIFFENGKSNSLIKQLKKTEIIPSQMNMVPRNDIQITDFEEAAYAIHNFTSDTKLRDLGKLEINKLKLSLFMSGLALNSRDRLTIESPRAEKVQRQLEKDKIIDFFKGSNAIEYNCNWMNAMYFILMSSGKSLKEWNRFEDNVRGSIKEVKILNLEEVKRNRVARVKSKMKKDLQHQFDICISTVLALNPLFSKKEKHEILELCYKIRKANLFNQLLVSIPLVNYLNGVTKDIDLSNIAIDKMDSSLLTLELNRKLKLSPRFINFDELFQLDFIRKLTLENGWKTNDKDIERIRTIFLEVNNINADWAKPLDITIDEDQTRQPYILQKIRIGGARRKLQNIRIAVANIKLDIDSCCMGLNGTVVVRNRADFVSFLEAAYNEGKNTVDYLVFPEFYLPISWIQDVLTFTRKTGITVISGLQYISQNGNAHNVITVFSQIKSGRYNSAVLFAREKNNYAPLEKLLVETECCTVLDNNLPIYMVYDDGGVKFGIFLCYEFTDICARALLKNEVDIIFTPENNSDTTYFSNIIETMSRDLHAFMVQANTSIYGDSRITGPYGRNYRNIVQIKGGDNDSIIIGTINLQEVIEARKNERMEMAKTIQDIRSMSLAEKRAKKNELKGSHGKKISKISARTYN